jgi:DNA invertase Pin-like site-specific DNA recombinase
MKIIIYVRQSFCQNGTEAELLRKSVENRGHTVIASFADDSSIFGKGKNAGWRALVARLDEADQVVVGTVGDLPGKTVADLFKILDLFRDHAVSLRLDYEGIDTEDGAAAILDLVAAYRATKLSRAIRDGQAKALARGRKTGRPPIPPNVRGRVLAAIAEGLGVRASARIFNVSPGSVVNLSRSLAKRPETLAA